MNAAAQFADWRAVTRVIARYGRFADQRRPEDMADLFVADGRMLMYRPRAETPAESPQGREQLIRAFSALSQFAVTSHVLSPSDVEIDGDNARVHTYCMSHHIREAPDGRTRFTLADRYDDTLVRVGDQWLFQERRKYTDWTESTPLRR
ncbi:nuclear transport factor 2 family protein [Microbacterium abyssi]|uniref:nuclear transport factor 2 family protein n=1 Tax=Microbacterium abyssi TaxID=2782166 RepID=UPI001889B9FA|nr:nuclear transport factor 2 family protein [Microbacterium sp. A18JL241]